MKGEENKKEKLECRKRIECTEKLYWNSSSVSPFYRELHKIFMDDHPQVTIMVQNLIFYNTYNINKKNLNIKILETFHKITIKNIVIFLKTLINKIH